MEGTYTRLILQRVLNGPLAEFLTRLTERIRLFHGRSDIPLIDRDPLDQPHRRRAVAAGAVDKGWLGAVGRNRIENFGGRGFGLAVKGDVEVPVPGGRRRRLFLLDLGAGFAGQPQVDDRDESHLLDSATASGVMAPAHATVVCSRASCECRVRSLS